MFILDSKSKVVRRMVFTDFIGLLNKLGEGHCQEVNKSADLHRQSMENFSLRTFTLPGYKGTGKQILLSPYQQLLAEGYY